MSETTTTTTTATPAVPVRVRIAPSPTGVPHVGFLRTALFNWAYARHTGGTFVLRIEDTDLARHSEESYHQMVEALRWLGLDWDEGVEVGGPHEPYRQSQRSALYADVLAKLVEGGYVYESFSTPEEAAERRRAKGEDPQRGYDNADRDTTDEQKAAFRAAGREPVWRLRMPDGDHSFHDLVRGEVRFPAGSVPDYVVARADGTPLYTLVNPVDDALMGITHVLRGEDLLSSTPRQLALFDALKAIGTAHVTPLYGHMPYVMGEGNRKLSKRDPESNLFVHRERGFLPEGLLNYLALLGWSIGPDRDVFTPAEMVEAFDIADVVASPSRFDLKKAEAINAAHVRLLSADDFRDRVLVRLQSDGVLPEQPSERQLALLAGAAPLVQERMVLLGEAAPMLGFLFTADDALVVEEDARASLRPEAADVLDASVRALEDLDDGGWTAAALEAALREALVDGLGVKPKFAFAPLRVAVTGRRVSPPLFESMELLGRSSSLARLRALRSSLG
jgi:glutamyl-tRNA synthetase